MSFSFSFIEKKSEVYAKLEDKAITGSTPNSVLTVIVGFLEQYADDQSLSVLCYGHKFDGKDYNVSSATIEVKPA